MSCSLLLHFFCFLLSLSHTIYISHIISIFLFFSLSLSLSNERSYQYFRNACICCYFISLISFLILETNRLRCNVGLPGQTCALYCTKIKGNIFHKSGDYLYLLKVNIDFFFSSFLYSVFSFSVV